MTPSQPSRRILVTAGNTREMIDRVRDWGNVFTGNTGYAIARAMAPLGHVDLLTSNRAHVAQAAQDDIHATPFTSHAQLKAALAALLTGNSYDAVVMTAAVADYQPAGVYHVIERTAQAGGFETWTVKNVQADKVKSTHRQIAVLGSPTEKIVDLFRTTWHHAGLLFKFKLEVGITKDELIQIGQSSRRASQADYLIANTLDMIEGPTAGAYLLSDQGEEFIPRPALPQKLADLVGAHPRGY